jgi:hypothetical protein
MDTDKTFPNNFQSTADTQEKAKVLAEFDQAAREAEKAPS